MRRMFRMWLEILWKFHHFAGWMWDKCNTRDAPSYWLDWLPALAYRIYYGAQNRYIGRYGSIYNTKEEQDESDISDRPQVER